MDGWDGSWSWYDPSDKSALDKFILPSKTRLSKDIEYI